MLMHVVLPLVLLAYAVSSWVVGRNEINAGKLHWQYAPLSFFWAGASFACALGFIAS